MKTNLNRNAPGLAPMVTCRGSGAVAVSRRKSLSGLLAEVRISSPEWYSRFEDANLSVVGGVSLDDVLLLCATAPGGPDGRLAGVVEGMYVNS